MNTAYIFPADVKSEEIDALVHRDNKTKRAINADILEKAQTVNDSFDKAQLREASKAGRLRCPCDWCLAQVYLAQRDGTLYFAHKPRTAAVCPHYWAQATELVGSTMRLFDNLKAARAREKAAKDEAEMAKGKVRELQKQLEKLQTFAPVLLLPLTKDVWDHRREIHEPRSVLFVISEAALKDFGFPGRLEGPGEMPGTTIPPAPPESEHVN